jgi:TfoX/Sxy family transcriptional regulator of competence genes
MASFKIFYSKKLFKKSSKMTIVLKIKAKTLVDLNSFGPYYTLIFFRVLA